MRTWPFGTLVFLAFAALAAACGGSDPEAEATWETHTTIEDDSAGGEDEDAAADDAEPASDPDATP